MPSLPFIKQLAYGAGMLGWSIMINTISVMLVYFYLPPSNSGLTELVPQITILGVFTVLALITASGRLIDAITDPLIAHYSDKSTHKQGRRIPFMKWSIIPAVLFCILIFRPPGYTATTGNLWWLFFIQAVFYFSLTVYIIPYNALLPELGHTSRQKLRLSTWQSVGFVLGIIISSQIPAIADGIQQLGWETNPTSSIQYTITGLCLLGGLTMFIPVMVIEEKKYCRSLPSTIPLIPALKQTLTNRNFLLFIVADFAYFTAVALITSGLLYYLEVLLGLDTALGGTLMGTMVLVSLLLYPFVNWLADTFGKKILMVGSFFWLAVIFTGIGFLGTFPVSSLTQAFVLVISTAVPLAFLGILPNAIIAEITEADSQQTGQNKEGMFFAAKTFFDKVGQTMGVMLFAMMTIYGKDPGDDLGIRLNGLIGCVLCLAAGITFLRFKEVVSSGNDQPIPDA